MKLSRLLDRRAGFSLASITVLLAMVAPSLLPAFASAAQVTSRSIKMSTSQISTASQYTITFTTPTGIPIGGGLIIDFCSDSPVYATSCTPPTGFSITSPAITASTGTPTAPTTNTLKIASTTVAVAAAGTYTTAVTSGITNPSTTGTFYARIYTYTTGANETGYVSSSNPGTVADNGGIALSTSNTIGVSAIVMETLQFCVSKLAPGPSCGGSGQAVTTPTLTLGHGSPLALDASAINTDTAYTQISTNANSGAIVRMTNNNSCGGLYRAGATLGVCDIPAANSGGGTAAAIPTLGAGGFGLQIGTAVASGTGFGTVTVATPYTGTGTSYGMDTTTSLNNVTTTYGGTIFSTTAPVGNMNEPFTFGAAAATVSPAGTYSANMNLVATGTF